MAKLEERPVDSGVVGARALDDGALADWWKKRLTMVASVPTEVARAGALLPQMRQLARLPEADRRRLTKARIQAFLSLAGDQRQQIMAARRVAETTDPELTTSDAAVIDAIAPEVPGAPELLKEMRRR